MVVCIWRSYLGNGGGGASEIITKFARRVGERGPLDLFCAGRKNRFLELILMGWK